MDDIEVIRQFRGETPEPTADVTARARSTLLSAMEQPTAQPRRKVRQRWTSALAVAAAMILAVLFIPVSLPGSGSRDAATAAEVLRRAASVAAEQETTTVGSGQYVYTKSEDAWQSCAVSAPGEMTCTLDRYTREIWIAPDGSGRILQDGDRALDEEFGPGGLYFNDLTQLPTDVEALRGYLTERAEQADMPTGYSTFILVGDLLRETNPSPALRSALFRIASALPGVELIGETTDELGRPGIAVGYALEGRRWELIFDPETSAIIGEREVDVETGEVLGWSSVLDSGVVDSTTEVGA
jgi:hypothetical protein